MPEIVRSFLNTVLTSATFNTPQTLDILHPIMPFGTFLK